MANSRYRPEIDGIRALAILPVVLFHAGFKTFSGGFVGVDIFFVISGYLISDHLYREAQSGRIDIADFYRRRVRRIFPALFFLLGCVFAAGYVLMLPLELARLGQSAMATTFFVSNVYFYLHAGYFEPAAILSPLLHTWSLSVEEQYYIVWPILLFWIQQRWPRHTLRIVIVAALFSLALSLVTVRHAENATFYMLPTRAWELLAGAVLAISGWSPTRGREILSWGGVALIAAASLHYTEGTLFPGAAAIPPVLGGVLLLAAAGETLLGRLLSAPPLRAIGLISYSLYLWHWPVLAFARLIFGNTLPVTVAIGCVLFATAAATFSWWFVERPFRQRVPRHRSSQRWLFAAMGTMAVSAGIAIMFGGGLPIRMPPNVIAMAAAAALPDPTAYPCWVEDGANPDVPQCLGGTNGRRTALLWGDSHARPFVAPLAGRTVGRAEVRIIGRASCMPFDGIRTEMGGRPIPGCEALNHAVLDRLQHAPDIDTVILAGRWARLFFPDQSDEAQRMVQASGTAVAPGTALARSFDRMFSTLSRAGKRIVVLGDVPEFAESEPECMARATWLLGDAARCRYDRDTLPGSASDQALHRIAARHPEVQFVWPAAVLCPAHRCRSELNGIPVSRDTDHLTDAAADFVIDHTMLAALLKD